MNIEQIFGSFKYKSNSNGSITILDDWVKGRIRRIYLNSTPIFTHVIILPQLYAIYKELVRFRLEHTFDLSNGGGCFVPRHKSWNIKRSISLHSWGIAIDINPKEYPYGSTKQPHPVLIQAFEKHGFKWGGDWQTPDPMHFQWEKFTE